MNLRWHVALLISIFCVSAFGSLDFHTCSLSFSPLQWRRPCKCFDALYEEPMGKLGRVAAQPKRQPAHARSKISVKKKVKSPVASGARQERSSNERKLKRWTSDEFRGRAIKLKLGMYPLAQVDGNLDSDQRTIDQNVARELKKLKGNKKHLSLAFWNSLIESHKLTGNIAESLPQPQAAEKVDKDLDVALRQCHASNPAARSATRLCRLLEYIPLVNETSMFGLLHASFESPSLSRAMSRTMLEAVLGYMARVRADLEFPHYFQVVQNVLDEILCTAWQSAQSDEQSRSHFVRARRQELQMFMDMEVATRIDVTVAAGKTCEVNDVEKMLKGSEIAKELFSDEARQIEGLQFVREIDKRIYDLECESFEPDEVASFKRIMYAHAEAFDCETAATFDGKELTLPFIGHDICTSISVPNDEWRFRLDSRIKTLAVSMKKVPRTPWEIMLYGEDGRIPNTPEFVDIPDSLLYDIRNARDYLLDVIGPGWQSVETLRATVESHLATTMKSDKTFWLEKEFFLPAGGPFDLAIDQHLKNCLLTILPSSGQTRSFGKGVAAARQLTTGDIVVAQKKTLVKELTSATSMMNDILDNQGPSSAEAAKLSDFAKLVLKKCENYCRVPVPSELVERVGGRTTLSGGEGLKFLFEQMAEKKKVQDSSDLKVLRSFKWMLSTEELRTFDEWEREAVLNARDTMQASKNQAIKDLEKELAAPAAAKRTAAKEVAAPPLKEKRTSAASAGLAMAAKKAAAMPQKEEAVSDTPSGLLSFFGTKAL